MGAGLRTDARGWTMSKEAKTEPDEDLQTPTRENVIEYLEAHGALSPPCPACGKMTWGLGNGPENFVSVYTMQKDMNAIKSHGLTTPVVILSCTNCGFIREHSAMMIGRWVKNGKK